MKARGSLSAAIALAVIACSSEGGVPLGAGGMVTSGGSGGTPSAGGDTGTNEGGVPAMGGQGAYPPESGGAGGNSGGMGNGSGCRVGETVYPDGAVGIDDPFSCNTCACADGFLECTDVDCPIECPAETIPGVSCDMCGPADECLVAFHGCLERCVSSEGCPPAMSSCFRGMCRNICG